LTITNPSAVCSPGTIDLTTAAVTAGSFLPTGTTLTYWTDAGATTILATPAAVTVSGTYYIKAETSLGCSDIQPVIVTINPTPVLAITNPAAACLPGTVDLTATAVTAGSTFPAGTLLTYWTDAAATIAFTTPAAVDLSGTYYIKAETALGCSDIQPVDVTINQVPKATISYAFQEYCILGSAPVIQAGQTGGIYSASPAGLSIDPATGAINLATSKPGFTYTITYTFTNGSCSNTTNTTVKVNPLPNTSTIYHD
jgi:hypothetical protein